MADEEPPPRDVSLEDEGNPKQAEDEVPPEEVLPKRRAFIHNVDGYIGSAITDFFKTKNFDVIGTVNFPFDHKKPAYLDEVFHVPFHVPVRTNDNTKQSRNALRTGKEFEKAKDALLACDVIICPLMHQGKFVNEILETLATLSEQELSQKVFIGITSPLTWAKTIPFKSFEAGPACLSERDEARRRGTPSMRATIETERVLLRAQQHYRTKGLRTYVMCPGLLYGNGESKDAFFSLFQTAWESTVPVPIYDTGSNCLPTLHVQDLAQQVLAVLDQKPKQQYIIACDKQQVLLRDIAQAIAEVFYAKTEEVGKENYIMQSGIENLVMNVRLKPSTVLDPAPAPVFEEEGLLANTAALREKFVSTNKLEPLRVVLWGPPLSGKTYAAEVISKQYTLQRIHVKYLVDVVLPMQDEEFIAGVNERKGKPVEVKAPAAAKAAKGGKGGKGAPPPAVDDAPPVDTAPRLAEMDLVALAKIAMESATAMNQGWILDGFPKNYECLKELFTEVVELPEPTPSEAEAARLEAERKAAEAAEEAKKKKGGGKKDAKGAAEEEVPEPRGVIAKYAPTHFFTFKIKAAEQTLRAEAAGAEVAKKIIETKKEEAEAALAEWHATEEYTTALKEGRAGDLIPPTRVPSTEEQKEIIESQQGIKKDALSRRMGTWDGLQKPNAAGKVFADTFTDFPDFCLGTQVELLEEENLMIDPDPALDLIRNTLVSPHNFKGFVGEDPPKQITQEEFAAMEAEKAAEEAKRQAQREHRAKIAELKAQEEESARRQVAESVRARAEPTRQFLLETLMPYLTEGLILCCKERPDDDIDFMAHFLRKKAEEVRDSKKFIRFGARNSRQNLKDLFKKRMEELEIKNGRRCLELPEQSP